MKIQGNYKLISITLVVLLILAGTLMISGVASAQTPVGNIFDSTATIDTIGLTATDHNITKKSVPDSIQTWIKECDQNTVGAYITTNLVGDVYESYLYYNGGGRYRWSVEVDELNLSFNLLTTATERAKGDEGYTLIKFQMPTMYSGITVSVDGKGVSLDGTTLTIADELSTSIQYDRVAGSLSLSIPQYTQAEQQISLKVTGRLFGHEDSMKISWTPFVEAEADGWVPGKTYTGNVQLSNVDYIEIAGIVKEIQSNEIAGQFVVLLNQEGNMIKCEQIPAAGNKDSYYKQILISHDEA